MKSARRFSFTLTDQMNALRWLFFGAAVWLVSGAGSLIAAETLTIATYNIENYGVADRMTAEGYRKDYPKPEREKTALRKVIHEINADILVMQEIGPRAYLDELQRDLRREGMDYSYAELLEAADDDRHVGILSRRPFSEIQRHTGLIFPYFGKTEPVKRGLLEVRFATTAGTLAIFAVHLKSRFSDRADDPKSTLRRTGEATAIRDAICRRCSDPASDRFLILGDFNDDKNSKPLQRIQRRGKTVIAELLPAVDSRGETWTHAYGKEDSYSRVDHVLVSAALAGDVQNGKATIFDSASVRDASDHRPVVVTLTLGSK